MSNLSNSNTNQIYIELVFNVLCHYLNNAYTIDIQTSILVEILKTLFLLLLYYWKKDNESPRVFRRQFILSHATLADSSNWR